ncbi:MAG TPA: hypothetical protein VMH20_13770 [Verrucomicrobiae bacterium]|nr:hypothetical protein [Verrucomicrobiae bacterium]
MRFFFFNIDDQALLSGRLDRYLRCAAWAEIALFLACSFLVYCSYLTIIGDGQTPLRYQSVQLLVGAIGGAGALGGFFLYEAMWTYWKAGDSSGAKLKRFWFFTMTFVPMFGCIPYYFVVYQHGSKGQRKP